MPTVLLLASQARCWWLAPQLERIRADARLVRVATDEVSGGRPSIQSSARETAVITQQELEARLWDAANSLRTLSWVAPIS